MSKGVFVVTSTRTGSGRIASGRRGRCRGSATTPALEPILRIAAEDLAPVKARILLMLAIAAKADGAAIQRMFTEY